MLLWMLIACPAERLGVEVPTGGADAISAEDLQRDVYALSRADADVAEVFARRLTQMHLPPKEREADRVCAVRGGSAPGAAPRVVVAPWPTTPAEAASAAVLVSVAKGWDGQPPPKRTTWLCVARADAALPEGERVPSLVVEVDRIEAIDYRRLRDDTKALFAKLDG
jgi:hypothetical protein